VICSGVEEAGAPTGEALGGGGKGAHRWRGNARRSRKMRSSTGDGGCSSVRSGGRHRVDRSGWKRRHEDGRREIEREGGWQGVRQDTGSTGHPGVRAHLTQVGPLGRHR
jgi:hypothetical protein